MRMIQPGGRKLVKGTLFTSIDPSTFQPIFDEFTKLMKQYPETIHSGAILELHSHEKIVELSNQASAFGLHGKWYQFNVLLHWDDRTLDEKV
jgi:hypothetical protein